MNRATTPSTKRSVDPALDALQSIVGPENAYSAEKDRHLDIDGTMPSAVVEPATYDEVAEVLRFANSEGLAVIPLGDGNFRWIGNIPSRYDIALKTARLTAIVEYEPADLTLTCQAGATLADLSGPLDENGQMVPFGDIPANSRIGRLLALRGREIDLAWGTPRDFTIGLRVVTADGHLVRTGGKVVKNVAGYDLTKLFIGSMGTLGVIVEATFKLAPAPQIREDARLAFPSAAAACAFASELQKRGLSVSYVRLDRPIAISETRSALPPGVTLTLSLAGTATAVERSRREITTLAAGTGGTIEPQERPRPKRALPASATAADPLMCQASVLPTLVPHLIDEIDQAAPGAFLEASPLHGSISMTWLNAGADGDLLQRARHAVAKLGGTLTVISCDTELKRQIDVFGEVPPKTLDLMRRIKQQFDPNGILSPGRFVGRL